MFLSSIFTLIFVLSFSQLSSTFEISQRTVLKIDCGIDSPTTISDSWLSDQFYTGGVTALIPSSSTLDRNFLPLTSIRHFPLSYGKKNCYSFSLSSGLYRIGLSFVYGNYDNMQHPPAFEVALDGTVVMRPPFWPQTNYTGILDDYFREEYRMSVKSGFLNLCFYNTVGADPLIAAIELDEMHPLAYGGSADIWLNFNHLHFGSRLSYLDTYGRSWVNGENYLVSDSMSALYTTISTNRFVSQTASLPNEFPLSLFQYAIVGDKIELQLLIDGATYGIGGSQIKQVLVWLHFAEIDPNVTRQGQRIFNLMINDSPKMNDIDIFREVGAFTAYSIQLLVPMSSTELNIRLEGVVGNSVICGMEVSTFLGGDYTVTKPEEVEAMIAVKESLLIPRRLGWNGDPCTPSQWQAWEGVICTQVGNSMVITEITLVSQGLRGKLPYKIAGLRSLVSLNLSRNFISGSIPHGLGNSKSLKVLDLSFNNLAHSVPEDLWSSNISLFLAGNEKLCGFTFSPCREDGAHFTTWEVAAMAIATILFLGIFCAAFVEVWKYQEVRAPRHVQMVDLDT